MNNKVFVGDVGTIISVDTTVNIEDATVHVLDVIFPDSTTATWVATQNGEFLEYTSEDGDLDQYGIHIIRARIETSAGKWRGTETTFRVHAV